MNNLNRWKGVIYLTSLAILCINQKNHVYAIYDPSNYLATRYESNTTDYIKGVSEQIQMHHNYSRVSHQTTVTTVPYLSASIKPAAATPVPLLLRKPRNYYHDAKPLQVKRQRHELVLSNNGKCPQSYTGQIPLTDSCHMFLNCHKGRGIPQSCAPGTLFNPDRLECDHAHKVTCFPVEMNRGRLRKSDMRSLNVGQRIGGQQQVCPKGFIGIMPNYGDCGKFIMCQGGDSLGKVVMDCAPGTLFDCRSNLCKMPKEAECFYGADLTESETWHQPEADIVRNQQQPIRRTNGAQYGRHAQQNQEQKQSANNLECPPGNIGSLLPHPVNCDQYLQCDHGRTHIRPCGPGTVFNPQLGVCDWPFNVKGCGENGTTNGESDPYNDSRFHNGYTNRFNGNGAPFNGNIGNVGQYDGNTRINGPYYGNRVHNQTSTAFNRTSVEYNPQIHTFDNEYHENFGVKTILTTTPIPIEDEQGGYGYYLVRPTRMTPQIYKSGGKWPPPFPETENTDFDYIVDYEELPETTTVSISPNRVGTTTTTDKYIPYHYGTGNNGQNHGYNGALNCRNVDQQFQCQSNQCIDISLVCDMTKDCQNGKDEFNCAQSILQFSQIASAKLAIKDDAKFRNVTITYCAKLCHEAVDFICKSFNYRQVDRSCFLLTSNVAETGLLIQMPTYTYYEHVAHNLDCTNMFRCKNKKCIARSKMCNGIDDCLDRQDERDCAPDKFGYELTLETPSGYPSNEGNLVVTAFKRRGYICDDGFTMTNAHVACRELGYVSGALQIRSSSYYPITNHHPDIYRTFNGSQGFYYGNRDSNNGSTFYIMDDVVCFGEEQYLKDCYFTGWGVNDCRDGEIVGVVCLENSGVGASPLATTHKPIGQEGDGSTGPNGLNQHLCAINEWVCHSQTECLPMQYLCDGIYDCADSSDEWERLCTSPLEIRLVNENGKNMEEGRVEVRYHGTWGTICDDGFRDKEATVACRQLLDGGKIDVIGKVVRGGLHGPGFGPIWFDQVTCTGNETDLKDCGHAPWDKHNCEHNEDVAIRCTLQQKHILPTIKGIKGGGNQRQYGSSISAGFRRSKIEDLEPYNHPGKCGVRADDLMKTGATFRVLNAPVASPGTFPWQATISLRSHNVSQPVHWCGGVILSPYHVLTAAHCLDGITKSNMHINAGDYNRDADEGTEQIARVDDFIQHEEFRHGSRKNNDIAIIKLVEPGFRMTNDVNAICLPKTDVEYKAGTSCTVSGFGVTDQSIRKASRQLRASWIPIQTKAVCEMSHVYGKEILEGMFCAGSMEGGVDACDGDSGGPLACLHEGYFTLFGITSWGHKCGEANKPGVYVKVSYYRQWILDAIDKLRTE